MESNGEWWGLRQTGVHAHEESSGQLLLILCPPTVFMWKHGPKATRPPNILREAKRPGVI